MMNRQFMKFILIFICCLGKVFGEEYTQPLSTEGLQVAISDAVHHALSLEQCSLNVRNALASFGRREKFDEPEYRALQDAAEQVVNVSIEGSSGLSTALLRLKVEVVDTLLMTRGGWQDLPREEQGRVAARSLTLAKQVLGELFQASASFANDDQQPGPRNVVAFGENDNQIALIKQQRSNNRIRLKQMTTNFQEELRQSLRWYVTTISEQIGQSRESVLNKAQLDAVMVKYVLAEK